MKDGVVASRCILRSPTRVVRPKSWEGVEALRMVDFWCPEEIMVSELTHERSRGHANRERPGHGFDKTVALAGWGADAFGIVDSGLVRGS